MRVSLHGGRNGSPKHNNHYHVPETDRQKNVVYCAVAMHDCVDAEVEVYKRLYGDTLKKQNERHIKNRQYARTRTMEQWVDAPRYQAREEIYQIGDIDAHATPDELHNCVLDMLDWQIETFEGHMQWISAAFHFDEATPHCHARATWYYHDKDGNLVPGMAKALEEAGVPLPDPNKPVSKTNNRMMTYTAMCREKWQEICLAAGFEIETTPKERNTGHMGVKAYKSYIQAQAAVDAREDAVSQREDAVQDREIDLDDRETALNAAEADLQTRQKEMLNEKLKARKTANTLLERERKVANQERLVALGRQYQRILQAEQLADRVGTTADRPLPHIDYT